MIGYIPVSNRIDVFVEGFIISGSINSSNPTGTLILDAVMAFTIYDNTIPTAPVTIVSGVSMPLIDSSIAHYRGSVGSLGLLVGTPYLITVTCSNYEWSASQQFIGQLQPFQENVQYGA